MSYIQLNASEDVQIRQSKIRQLVDVVQSDISNVDSEGVVTNTRRKYEVFVTGGFDLNGVSSSLFQTIYDQDFTLQTSNAMFDITVGLFEGSDTVTNSSLGTDDSGKILFPSQSLMMREKISIYRQFALNLLGDASNSFFTIVDDTNVSNRIDEAVFLSFRRLFVRDNISKGTFAFRASTTSSLLVDQSTADSLNLANGIDQTNLYTVPNGDDLNTIDLFTTKDSSTEQKISPVSGEYGAIKRESNDEVVGLIYYDSGVVVLDAKKIFLKDQALRGKISSINPNEYTKTNANANIDDITIGQGQEYFEGPLIPDFFVSGSMDDIIDHVAGTRFLSGSATGIAYQNETSINSTLYFCKAGPNQFNYSTNPTYINENGRLRVKENDTDDSFAYVTTIGLYNTNKELVAVAKTSRPIEKNDETDLSIRVRLDY